MKLHDLKNEEDMMKVAERMWELAQGPELAEIMDSVAADLRLDRQDVLHSGFTFGAAFVLSELRRGNIREIHNG